MPAGLKLKLFMLYLGQWQFLESPWESPIKCFHAKPSRTPEEKEAEGPGSFWLGRTLSQLSVVSCGLQSRGRNQDAFPLQNGNFCWVPSLLHYVMLLKPRSSHFFFFPNVPFENKIIQSDDQLIVSLQEQLSGHEESGSERTEAVHSILIKYQHKIYYNNLYSSLTQPWANSYTI